VGRAFARQTFSLCRGVAIRDPIVKLPGRARTDVGREVRLRADQATEPHELMNAELVGLRRILAGRHPMLPEVVSPGTFGRWADAVAPMVAVGEASARPAEIRSSDSLHVINELLANPVVIRNPGIASDPNAVIDHAAEMLDEMPIQMRVDDR